MTEKAPSWDTCSLISSTDFLLCVNLVDTAVENITGAVRKHQQGQACVIVLRALQPKEVKQLMTTAQWTELCQTTADQLQQSLQHTECKNKAVHGKMLKAWNSVTSGSKRFSVRRWR
ncbi:myb-binding protein 1A-like protein [Electrophorus electricus]|uniref:myb-binding protein 1A-like protein n=1 Tax=Electrophorus electricus TaxID=8005 RepID=UPI0015D0B78F|nr:myb-binding protein 1A-like protein [Electrophorus electricus]